MSNTTAQATIVAGDVVWGRPIRQGKTQSRRKGIVLGTLSDTQSELVVWWYGTGAAGAETTTLMFRNELTKSGDIFDFNGRKASQLAKGCYHLVRAHSVGRSLESHARRMLSIGA